MDHKPLTYLSTFKDIMKRMFRWIQYVEEIGVKLVYVLRRENVLADFLSRNIKETPSSRVITCDSIKFNNLRYTENDIKTTQRAEEVLQKLIEIKKVNKKL